MAKRGLNNVLSNTLLSTPDVNVFPEGIRSFQRLEKGDDCWRKTVNGEWDLIQNIRKGDDYWRGEPDGERTLLDRIRYVS